MRGVAVMRGHPSLESEDRLFLLLLTIKCINILSHFVFFFCFLNNVTVTEP